jgi:hypothetical protein
MPQEAKWDNDTERKTRMPQNANWDATEHQLG